MINLTNELKVKLLQAKSAEEAAALLKEAGIDQAAAEQITKELTQKLFADGRKLSPDELEAVSGGYDRDWLTDGCAATVEAGSWCGSNDSCWNWDVTYHHEPSKHKCSVCGTNMYLEYRYTGLGSARYHYKCNNCGHEMETS